MQEQGSWWADRAHRTLVAVAGVAVLVVALVLWLTLRGGGSDNSDAAKPAASSSPTAGASALGQSSVPTGNPSATPPPAPKPLKHPPKPVRASFHKPVRTGGVTASIVRVESVKGQAQGIGEVAGPALRFTVKVTNTSGKPVNLDLTVVNVYYGPHRTPASQLSGPGSRPLPQTLKSGSATGRYVFGVPRDQRGKVQVEFSYNVKAPTVIFRGSAA